MIQNVSECVPFSASNQSLHQETALINVTKRSRRGGLAGPGGLAELSQVSQVLPMRCQLFVHHVLKDPGRSGGSRHGMDQTCSSPTCSQLLDSCRQHVVNTQKLRTSGSVNDSSGNCTSSYLYYVHRNQSEWRLLSTDYLTKNYIDYTNIRSVYSL